jgi:uncharacterized cupin superfamily protein
MLSPYTQMTKQNTTQDSSKIRILKWEKPSPVTQEEAEAILHREGYQSFCWYDVPGAQYRKHQHADDECLWILRGEMHFHSNNQTHQLKDGDRIYFPAGTLHSVEVPLQNSVTYLVGKKTKS